LTLLKILQKNRTEVIMNSGLVKSYKKYENKFAIPRIEPTPKSRNEMKILIPKKLFRIILDIHCRALFANLCRLHQKQNE
jgi:hypothetical protein